MEDIDEIWKDIKDYEGYYQVSNKSRFKSLDRIISFNVTEKFVEGKIMIKHFKKNGYPYVILCKNGIRKNMATHRLVAIAFINNPYNLNLVEHKDGNSFNDLIDNLFWSTQQKNMSNKNVKIASNDKTRIPRIKEILKSNNFLSNYNGEKN